MRNRAKCKLCDDIIESLALTDLQMCKCGEIGVEGGSQLFRTYAKNYDNFLRVKDDDTVIKVTVQKKEEKQPLTKEEKIQEIEYFIEKLEDLSPEALSAHATNYDILAIAYLLKLIIKD